MQFNQIGIIHTPFKRKENTPCRPSSKSLAYIEVFKKYQEGLADIENFSHLILLYKFHKSKDYHLTVKFSNNSKRGVFATRAPNRPNQIGLTIVKLVERKDNVLVVKDIDIIDGSPLLDIKPYIPRFDFKDKVKLGRFGSKLK